MIEINKDCLAKEKEVRTTLNSEALYLMRELMEKDIVISVYVKKTDLNIIEVRPATPEDVLKELEEEEPQDSVLDKRTLSKSVLSFKEATNYLG
jgi:hypothetical protein